MSLDLSPITLKRAALTLIIMLLSLSVHEFAHAWAADKLGDDTPRSQGRLTLSPLEHYDVFGTFLIPLAAVLFGGLGLIGWARPVQWNPSRITRKVSLKTGMILVAGAGPLSNLVLAVLASGALAAALAVNPALATGSGLEGAVVPFLSQMAFINLGLFVFNLIPLPPLDGSRLLPRSLDGLVERITPWSPLLLILIVMTAPRIIWVPVAFLVVGLESLFGVPLTRLGL